MSPVLRTVEGGVAGLVAKLTGDRGGVRVAGLLVVRAVAVATDTCPVAGGVGGEAAVVCRGRDGGRLDGAGMRLVVALPAVGTAPGSRDLLLVVGQTHRPRDAVTR